MSKDFIQNFQKMKLYGEWTFKIYDAKTGELKRQYKTKNILPTIGRSAIAAQLAGQETNDLKATYIAYGTGTDSATNGDTILKTEVYRKAVSSGTYSNNIAYIAGFLTAAEDADTYKEFAIFGDGIATTATGSPDTGILFSRVLQTITKTGIDVLVIEWAITIS